MGVVWAAGHEALEMDVAVKLIRPERVAADPALVTRFEREAKTAARLAHPHVVAVMDYGTVDGVVPYIVMELLGAASSANGRERERAGDSSSHAALASRVPGLTVCNVNELHSHDPGETGGRAAGVAGCRLPREYRLANDHPQPCAQGQVMGV